VEAIWWWMESRDGRFESAYFLAMVSHFVDHVTYNRNLSDETVTIQWNKISLHFYTCVFAVIIAV